MSGWEGMAVMQVHTLHHGQYRTLKCSKARAGRSASKMCFSICTIMADDISQMKKKMTILFHFKSNGISARRYSGHSASLE